MPDIHVKADDHDHRGHGAVDDLLGVQLQPGQPLINFRRLRRTFRLHSGDISGNKTTAGKASRNREIAPQPTAAFSFGGRGEAFKRPGGRREGPLEEGGPAQAPRRRRLGELLFLPPLKEDKGPLRRTDPSRRASPEPDLSRFPRPDRPGAAFFANRRPPGRRQASATSPARRKEARPSRPSLTLTAAPPRRLPSAARRLRTTEGRTRGIDAYF